MDSLIKYPLIGGVAFSFGAILDVNFGGFIDDVGEFLMAAGFIYGIASFIVIFLSRVIKYFDKKSAMKDLDNLDVLLRKGVLSKEEYDRKIELVKSKII
ncbi:hypothetical protein [Alcanivorax sp. VBW004]|uniref:hypothetical protein n=1 Tax=Alcanivorax sp. VBW004 TaxID=1287708 RepID=UPI0012BC6E16|nr:hypothetical protein [Alcanivorax sp. VBW004]